MNKILCILFFMLSGTLFAQKNDVLVTIGGHEISKAEFERIYQKNNRILADKSEVKSPKEYLELFINFKLKVIEAMNLKMDTSKSFREELAGYRAELAAPYLTDVKYDEKMVEELYRRMKQEINVSHILFRVNAGADKGQQLQVLQKARRVRQEILNGKDFNQAALQYSEDPSVKSNKGNIGYFTAFQMVAPFENCAFTTPVGQVSEPVRTSFGYHLVKVHDVRENQGEIKVAHIMKMFPRDETFDKAALKAEMDSVYQKLLQGASFEELVKRHSDDKRSVNQNGELPWFAASRMVSEFSQAAFALKDSGDFTPPVETPFGYHIIKKIGHRPVPPFEKVRASIEERIKKDPARSNSSRKEFVEKLKQEYGFEERVENTDKIDSLTPLPGIAKNLLLFTFDAKNFYLSDFKQYLQNEKVTAGLPSEQYAAWVENEIIQVEDNRLEEKYPEFRYLMQEYHDGLLFFNIMEEKIWKFAAEDSAGLEKYYASEKKKFFWEERFKGYIIKCKNTEVREEAENYFQAQLWPEEVEDVINQKEKQIEITKGAWEKGDNPVVDYYVWQSPAAEDFNPELTFIRGDVVAPEPKTLEEAKGLYISAYQDFIERNWIELLRKKYKIKVNKKLLKKVQHV